MPEAVPGLDDDGRPRAVGERERLLDRGEVLDAPGGFDAAVRGPTIADGPRVPDARGEFGGGEPAEDHGVDGADPRAREHGDGGLRDHRQVDEHAVALGDAEACEDAREDGDLVAELRIREGAADAEHRGVVDEGRLIAPAGVDVAVERVVAGVQARPREPAVQGCSRAVYGDRGWSDPVHRGRRPEPEPLRVREALRVEPSVARPGKHRASGVVTGIVSGLVSGLVFSSHGRPSLRVVGEDQYPPWRVVYTGPDAFGRVPHILVPGAFNVYIGAGSVP